jgi:hypothetical protein
VAQDDCRLVPYNLFLYLLVDCSKVKQFPQAYMECNFISILKVNEIVKFFSLEKNISGKN